MSGRLFFTTRAVLTTLVLVGSTTCSYPSVQSRSDVDQFVLENGGCAFIPTGWERQFLRADHAPFNKAYITWTPSDYQAVRNWVESCLDSFSAAAGHRKYAMGNVDVRIENYRRDQQELTEKNEQEQKKQKILEERRQRIKYLQEQLSGQLEELNRKRISFDKTSDEFFRTVKIIDAGKLDQLGAEAKSIDQLGDIVRQATGDAKITIASLHDLGTESGALPRLEKVNAVREQAQKIELLKLKLASCGAILAQRGVPQNIVRTRVHTNDGDNDPFLFEYLCPNGNSDFGASLPGWFSQYFVVRIGGTRLSFKLTSKRDGLDDLSRLVMVRVRSQDSDVQADTAFESGALAQEVFMMLLFQ